MKSSFENSDPSVDETVKLLESEGLEGDWRYNLYSCYFNIWFPSCMGFFGSTIFTIDANMEGEG